MDLRRRITKGLAGVGAFLIVAGFSLGGGAFAAESGPTAEDKTKPTSSERSEKKRKSDKKDSKSKKSTSTTSADAPAGSGDPDDSSGPSDPAGSRDSTDSTGSPSTTATTATTATSTPSSTASPTTATTATTRPTTTTTTRPAATTGSHNGAPITATEDEPTTTTIDDGRNADSPPAAKKPAARSGSGGSGGAGPGAGLPPGIYPVEPGARTASSPAPGGASQTPAAPVPANPPIVVTETTEAGGETTSTTTAAADSAGSPADTEVRSADAVQEESPAPASRRNQQLSQTGDSTRQLLLLGGVALLIGAVVVGFVGRDGPLLAAAAALPAGPARRRSPRPRSRRELDGWEDGIPLAPAKRELARSKLGFSAESYFDDEPGA